MYWPPSGELMKQQQQHGSSFSPALAGLTFTSRSNDCWLATGQAVRVPGRLTGTEVNCLTVNSHSFERSSFEIEYESVNLSVQLTGSFGC